MTTTWQVFVLLCSSDSLRLHLTAHFHWPYGMDFSAFCSYPEATVEFVLKTDSGHLIQILYYIENLQVKWACCNSRKSISHIILWFTQNSYRQNQIGTFQEGTVALTICSKGHCFTKTCSSWAPWAFACVKVACEGYFRPSELGGRLDHYEFYLKVCNANEFLLCRLEHVSAQREGCLWQWYQNADARLCSQWWQIGWPEILWRGEWIPVSKLPSNGAS